MVVTRGAEKRGTGVGLREKGERGSGNGCVHIIPSVLLISSKSSSSRATPSSLRSSLGFRINKASTISRLFSLHPWTARRQLPKWTRTLAERIKEKERERTLSYRYLTTGWDELPLINVFLLTAREWGWTRTHTHTLFLSLFLSFLFTLRTTEVSREQVLTRRKLLNVLSLFLSLSFLGATLRLASHFYSPANETR